MNDSTTPAPQATLKCVLSASHRKLLSVLLLGGVVIGTLASCSHDPNRQKKKRKPKHRDPVEQKVFYDGWWPKRL